MQAVRLDPERQTVETRLDDNRVPGQFQLLARQRRRRGLVVGVRHLDAARRPAPLRLSKDLALAGFYTSRGTGFDAGAQWHGGTPIDANLYRHNLFAYYTFVDLDSSFENKQEPAVAHARSPRRLRAAVQLFRCVLGREPVGLVSRAALLRRLRSRARQRFRLRPGRRERDPHSCAARGHGRRRAD